MISALTLVPPAPGQLPLHVRDDYAHSLRQLKFGSRRSGYPRSFKKSTKQIGEALCRCNVPVTSNLCTEKNSLAEISWNLQQNLPNHGKPWPQTPCKHLDLIFYSSIYGLELGVEQWKQTIHQGVPRSYLLHHVASPFLKSPFPASIGGTNTDPHWSLQVYNQVMSVKFKSNITRLHFSIFRLVFHHVPWEIPMNQSDESPVPGFSLRKSPEISENAMPWQPPWRRGWCSARHIGLLSSPDILGSFRRCLILGEVELNTLERFRTCEKYEGGWNSTLWKGGKNWRKQLKTLSRAVWHCTYHWNKDHREFYNSSSNWTIFAIQSGKAPWNNILGPRALPPWQHLEFTNSIAQVGGIQIPKKRKI